jgi:hypothetical protein
MYYIGSGSEFSSLWTTLVLNIIRVLYEKNKQISSKKSNIIEGLISCEILVERVNN